WVVLGYPLHVIAWNLLVGWLLVAYRASSLIDWNLAGIATGIMCVALLAPALHYFGVWMYREVRAKQDRADWPAAWRWKWTLCLIGATMLMFIAGLVGVGLYRTTSWFLDTPVIFVKKPHSLS